jgi:CRISPR-associated protein Cas2
MSRPKQLHVYAYDITDDRRRVRAAHLLENEGARVQHSVFEVIQSHEAAKSLSGKLMEILAPGDKLRVYSMPIAQISNIICYGGTPVQEGADYWLL